VARIIAIINQKGGSAKTTTAVNLGACMAYTHNRRVLLADMDPQGHATTYLAHDPTKLKASLYNVLVDRQPIGEVTLFTSIERLQIAPSNSSLASANIDLVSRIGRETLLRDSLQPIRQAYDFVLLDSPPSLGLLAANCLCAADGLIIPVEAEFFALEGLSRLLQTIELVQSRLNRDLAIIGVVLTKYDRRLNLARDVESRLQDYFKGKAKVFKTRIRRNVRIGESPSYGLPIILYDASSFGAQDYESLTQEVLRECEKVRTRANGDARKKVATARG
jgi:chromosome partitioning protein